ncbi:MAG: VOC family protein [Candidatus Binatia bacterium]
MLEFYRLDHVSQVVPDLDPQVELMVGLFGYRRMRSWENQEAGCRGVRLAVPGTWNQHWEVLAPLGDATPLAKWLEERGGRGGLHHVAFEVPDVASVEKELAVHGVTVTNGQAGKWVEVSLSPPDQGLGVLFRINGPGNHSMCGDNPKEWPDTVEVSEAPSLGIANIDHVCQAFRDRDELARWYEEVAGFVQVWRTPDDEHPDMADLVMNVPGSSICWEIIMPWGDEGSFIARFLQRSGPIAHHVTLEVRNWDKAMEACQYHGVEPFDENSGETDGAKWRDIFLHPKQTGGVLTQLFWEERPGVWVRSDKIPPKR